MEIVQAHYPGKLHLLKRKKKFPSLSYHTKYVVFDLMFCKMLKIANRSYLETYYIRKSSIRFTCD